MNPTLSSADHLVSQVGAFNLDVLLALAAILLGLSLAVQVIQELYKFVTTSKAKAYRKALIDFIGSEIDDGRKDRTLGGMLLRGPFQWLARQRPAHLLPSDSGEVVRALERTVSTEVQDALQCVRDEASRQGGVPRAPSPSLCHWFEELRSIAGRSPCAQEIMAHLDALGVTVRPDARDSDCGPSRLCDGNIDAASVLDSLYGRFLPKAKIVLREFEQFTTNFDYAYRRRNLRQTLVIAFLLAIVLNLPLDGLYRQARALSPEQVMQVADSALKLEGSIRARAEERSVTAEADAAGRSEEAATGDAEGSGNPAGSPGEGANNPEGSIQSGLGGTDQQLRALLDDLKKLTEQTLTLGTEERVFRPIWESQGEGIIARLNEIWERMGDVARPANLLACLATAVLIVFGAPFWHRLSKALLAVRRPVTEIAAGPARSEGGA